MDLPTIIGFMAVFLAVFAIGLSNIPQNILSQYFFGKREEDEAVMNKFLAIMGLAGLVGFIAFFGYFIAYLTIPLANYLVTHFSLHSWIVPLFELLFGLIAVLLVVCFIRWAHKRAIYIVNKEKQKSLSSISTSTNKSIVSIDDTSKENDTVDLTVTADLAKMNEAQLEAFNNYINYLESKKVHKKPK